MPGPKRLAEDPLPVPLGVEEVTDVQLLLAVRQLAELEVIACHSGVTVGQLVRRIIGAFLSRRETPKDG